MSSFQCWRWAGCCWCWQCGRVPEPSCVALCDFNHPPTRQPEDPIAPHMPMPTRTTHRIPSASNFFRRRNWMFLPKEKLSDTSLIRSIIPRVFRCWILLLDTRLMASWIVDCGLWKPRCQEDSPYKKLTGLAFWNLNLNLEKGKQIQLFVYNSFSFSESLTNIFLSIVYTRAAAACGDASIRWPIVSNISSPDSISGYLNEGGRVGAQEIVMNEIRWAK